jgi:hypothetical protein
MIEGFDDGSLVIINLVNPKEKFLGILKSVSPAGVTIRAINLDSFEDWMRQVARKDPPDIGFATMFVPLFRVERIFLDEPTASIPSFAEQFYNVVGQRIDEVILSVGEMEH